MIRVSDITAYLKCPRKCYFINKGHELPKDARVLEGMMLKELAHTYGSAFNSGDRLSVLNNELNRISNEIRIIYRPEIDAIDDATLANATDAVRSSLENISINLSSCSEFYACTGEIEPFLMSEKHELTGSPDRLVRVGNEVVPSIIKTGAMPENGAWKSDRLALTAYAILVEEMYNTVVERGFVEYARWGSVREVAVKRHERRKVLQLKNRIKEIHDGFMPERPMDAPCETCGFKEICEVKSTLASRFF